MSNTVLTAYNSSNGWGRFVSQRRPKRTRPNISNVTEQQKEEINKLTDKQERKEMRKEFKEISNMPPKDAFDRVIKVFEGFEGGSQTSALRMTRDVAGSVGLGIGMMQISSSLMFGVGGPVLAAPFLLKATYIETHISPQKDSIQFTLGKAGIDIPGLNNKRLEYKYEDGKIYRIKYKMREDDYKDIERGKQDVGEEVKKDEISPKKMERQLRKFFAPIAKHAYSQYQAAKYVLKRQEKNDRREAKEAMDQLQNSNN